VQMHFSPRGQDLIRVTPQAPGQSFLQVWSAARIAALGDFFGCGTRPQDSKRRSSPHSKNREPTPADCLAQVRSTRALLQGRKNRPRCPVRPGKNDVKVEAR